MTPLDKALAAHYRIAVIESQLVLAVSELAALLAADTDLRIEATAYRDQLQAMATAVGGIDRLRQRDFVMATHLEGLSLALAQL